MNSNAIIKDYEDKIKALVEENYKLYVENIKLKNSTSTTKSTSPKKSTKKSTTPKATKSNGKKSSKKKSPKNINKQPSEFQLKREEKKSVVVAELDKNTSVENIAKMINQSVPTVRNYIRELKSENRISR